MKTRKFRRPRGGFTLLEVLLVLAILVILASAVTFSIVKMQKKGYQQTAKLQIHAYEQSATAYYIDCGQFPMQLNDLLVQPGDLSIPEKWNGPYLNAQLQKDPWGVDYFFESADEQVHIWSSGPDKISGNEDDISNI